jgi:chromosomal replication initiation ATPase DnaA
MRSSSQLPLPLPSNSSLSRADFIVAPSNERAVAFIDSWPDWPARIAALYGPPGCGKTHLASAWREKSHAVIVAARSLAERAIQTGAPLVIEDVDSSEVTPARDAALFTLLEFGSGSILLTGKNPPAAWTSTLPDLVSRFSALTALPLAVPDETLLAALARKLFSDRQLFVPDVVIETMLRRIDRSPAAITDFVAELDGAALADNRPVSIGLVRSLIAARTTVAP